MERGDVWWAELPEPDGSGPGGRRPVVVVSSDLFNRSTIQTVIVAIITSRLDRAEAPGNILVPAKNTGLVRDSVINVSQLFTVDRATLTSRAGQLGVKHMKLLDNGLRLALTL